MKPFLIHKAVSNFASCACLKPNIKMNIPALEREGNLVFMLQTLFWMVCLQCACMAVSGFQFLFFAKTLKRQWVQDFNISLLFLLSGNKTIEDGESAGLFLMAMN